MPETKTLQFLIDHVCANFTITSLLGVVRTCVVQGPCTMSDITGAIILKDRSLDIKCAAGLAEGAVDFLADTSEVVVRESLIYTTGSAGSGKLT